MHLIFSGILGIAAKIRVRPDLPILRITVRCFVVLNEMPCFRLILRTVCAHVPTVATVPVACCPDANGSGPHGEHAIPCFFSIGKREKELQYQQQWAPTVDAVQACSARRNVQAR